MVFTEEKIKVKQGLLEKEYTIKDEEKAAELAIQKELIQSIKDLTMVLQASR